MYLKLQCILKHNPKCCSKQSLTLYLQNWDVSKIHQKIRDIQSVIYLHLYYLYYQLLHIRWWTYLSWIASHVDGSNKYQFWHCFAWIRDGFRTAATSRVELFVIIVNGFQPLTIITKSSILHVAAVLDSLLWVRKKHA